MTSLPRRPQRSSGFSLRPLALEPLEQRRMLSTNVLSYHNDNQSLGANTTETELTPASVSPGTFAKRYATALDGQVYAQPLYVSDVNITVGDAQGHHRVVYAATEHDSLYAIDSDSGNVLWQVSFIDPSKKITTMPAGETGSGDLTPEIGITSTPVIDLEHNVLYVEAKTKEIRTGDAHPTHYVQTLHRVNLSDGSFTSTVIADTAYNGSTYYSRQDADPYTVNDRSLGNADGAVLVNGQWRVYFNAMRQLVRPGLMLEDGNLYLASASHGDNGPYHGWVLRYDVSGDAPVLSGVLNTTPNGGLGGIWQGGGITAIDEQGYLYFETGNGTFSPYRSGNQKIGFDAQGFPLDGNYGDSFLKVGPDTEHTSPTNQNMNGWGLKVVDYFTPFNEQDLDGADRDLGSAAPIILPDSLGSAAHPHLLLGSGKEGKLYLIDRDNMGKSDPSVTDHVVQTIAGAVSGLLNTPALANVGSQASPDYRVFFVPGYGGPVVAYGIENGALSGPVSSSNDGSYGYLSGSPSISQNGTANGIVWTIERNTHELRAYDAHDLTHVVYTSGQAGGNRDQFLGTSVKFSVPTVADGRVFVGTSKGLMIFGPPIPPTAVPAAPSLLGATATFPTQVLLNWTDNSDNEDLFRVERSLDGLSEWVEIGTAGVNYPTFTDDTAQPNSTYFYRVRSYNSFAGGSYSDYTNVAQATTSPNPTGSGDGLLGVYYNNQDFTGSTVTRIDPRVNFDWGNGTPAPGIGADTFSVVWTGVVRAGHTEDYTFYTTSDDGVRLWINGQLVINSWIDQGPTEYASAPIALTQGQTYPVRMEMYENGGGAVAQLRWSSAHTAKAFVPKSALYSGSAPAAPTDLVATAASGTQINLTWTDNSNIETGFRIERKQGAEGAFEQVALVAPDATSFMDTALLADTTYYYRVQATNFSTDSPFSNEANATTPVPPHTPSNAHPTAVTTNSIAFSWQDNSDNEDKFSIFRKAGTNGSFIFIGDVPANTTAYTDSTLNPGVYYDYHIQAANLGGYTDFAGFSVTTITLPPQSPTATAAADRIDLTWSASQGADTYNVYRGTSAGGEGAAPVATGLTTPNYADHVVTVGVTYYYRVTAVTTGGESAPADEVFATATSGGLPGDANGDGHVDLTDFGILKTNFGTGATPAEGDFNGDGQVDLSDFGILKENFGAGGSLKTASAGGQPLAASASVERPAGSAMLVQSRSALAADWVFSHLEDDGDLPSGWAWRA